MTRQTTRGDQDRPHKRIARYTAYLPIREGQSIDSIMKEELISIRHTPPTQQDYAVILVSVQGVICQKSS